MGKLRTINHPGIETQEVDMSGSTEQVGGTTTLVMGFFPQGESNKPVRPTSLTAVKSYFGTPENEAERYAYYAAKTVFDNGGNLIASRIPYNNNSQYLTPAVKYDIQEWATKHITEYTLAQNGEIINNETAVFGSKEITDEDKENFYYGKSGLSIHDFNSLDYIQGTEEILNTQTITNAISSTSSGSGSTTSYYTIENNGNFVVSDSVSPTAGDDSFNFEAYVDVNSLDSNNALKVNGTTVGFSSFTMCIKPEGATEFARYSFDATSPSATVTGMAGNTPVTANFSVNLDPEEYPETCGKFGVTLNVGGYYGLIYKPCYPLFDESFDLEWLKPKYSQYFKICKHTTTDETGGRMVHGTTTTGAVSGNAYAESVYDGFDKSNFYYSATKSSPVTAVVDAYSGDSTVESTAIKAFYADEQMQYPEMETDDYLELRIWDKTAIKSLSDLTSENADKFDIIHRTFSYDSKTEYCKIANSGFKSAPVTSDVTEGYYPTEQNHGPADVKYNDNDYIDSDALKIKGTDVFVADDNPSVVEIDPFGTGPMMVLSKIGTTSVDFSNSNNFFQLVTPYTSIEKIALNKSQKYQWIHWYTPLQTVAEQSVGGKNILLARTLGCEEADVPVELSEIENVVTITPDVDSTGFIPLSEYQDYRDGAKKPKTNSIVIANITEQKLGSDIYNNAVVTEGEPTKYDYSDEVLGIVPVLMGGFQALPRQSRIELPTSITNGRIFDAVEAIKRGSSIDKVEDFPSNDQWVDIKAVTLNPDGFVRDLGTKDAYDAFDNTYSNQLVSTVPAIDLNAKYKPNGAKVNYVTLAVCQLTLSKVNNNKIALTVMETFTGSLDPNAKGEDGQTSMFIDDIVNNEDTGSTYVRLFSNYETTLNGSESVTSTKRELVAPASNDTKATIVAPASLGFNQWWTIDKPSMSLGFTNEQTKKYISYATIVASLENTFDALSNVDEDDIDVVVDAGISTIANFIKRKIDENPELTKAEYDVFWENIKDVSMVGGWKSMCSKFTTFCQTTRKDCIALLDAPRNLCVKDNVKLAQPGSKYSVDFDILPKFNYLGTMNSSYAAGYCDWLLAVDDFTAKNVWLPPSIAAEGAVIYTDYNSNYWMAPAGQSRGNVTWAVDIAFNPNSAQQDSIYSKGWNYAISSSGNIMVWGQKTMLSSTSSFNRINVRRLFCRLERMVRKNSKWVIFEINNERTRNIYKDRIDPIFANVKAMGGINRYELICDNRNNTPAVVEAHEFRAAALVTPESVAEYIIITFFNVGQTMDFSEVYGQL